VPVRDQPRGSGPVPFQLVPPRGRAAPKESVTSPNNARPPIVGAIETSFGETRQIDSRPLDAQIKAQHEPGDTAYCVGAVSGAQLVCDVAFPPGPGVVWQAIRTLPRALRFACH
jgi:hypothetical protein